MLGSMERARREKPAEAFEGEGASGLGPGKVAVAAALRDVVG